MAESSATKREYEAKIAKRIWLLRKQHEITNANAVPQKRKWPQLIRPYSVLSAITFSISPASCLKWTARRSLKLALLPPAVARRGYESEGRTFESFRARQ